MDDLRRFGEAPAGVAFKVRPAAYVVVMDAEARVACVEGRSGIFLPGGGIEAEEDAVAAVHREVREECACELQLLGELPSAVQFFSMSNGRAFELRASFFLGRFGAEIDGVPEYEVQWLPTNPEMPPFFHECQAWAVTMALQSSRA
jgi:8-oxo-dGTP diphosphatase